MFIAHPVHMAKQRPCPLRPAANDHSRQPQHPSKAPRCNRWQRRSVSPCSSEAIMKSHSALAVVVVFVVSIVAASVTALPTAAQRVTPAAAPRTLANARPVAAHVVFTRASLGSRTSLPARNRFHFSSATHSFVSSDGSSISLQDLLNPVPPPDSTISFSR